jgi:hypothetical protein
MIDCIKLNCSVLFVLRASFLVRQAPESCAKNVWCSYQHMLLLYYSQYDSLHYDCVRWL